MSLALTNMYIKYWWMVKSCILKLCTTIYIYIYIYICNLGYVEFLSENAINKVSKYYRVST